MSCNFSLQKSATSFYLLFVGAAASLLGTQLLPTNALLIEQSVPNLTAANQWVKASTLNLVITEAPKAPTEFNNAKTSILIAGSSTNTPEVAEKLDEAGMLLGIAAVGASAVGVILSVKKANNLFKSNLRPSAESKENTIRLDQASRELQKKLLRLLHSDRDTANRLLSQVKMRNPNRSIDWYVEKVIYDLERDRGSY